MTHASLFSGIGGAEIAASMMGWENVFHCEIDQFCRKVLDYYYPHSVSYGNIKEIDFSKWKGQIDVLTGGFPCQPFSRGGKRRGANDNRYLWPEMLRAIDQIRPAFYVGENVLGITTMVLAGTTTPMASQTSIFGESDNIFQVSERYVIEQVCEDLEGIGYTVQTMCLPSCSVGAPHRRNRIFILAADNAQDTLRSRMEGGEDEVLADKLLQRHIESTGEEWETQLADGGRLRYIFDRWRDFPTQSPLCGGDDGIPAELGNTTISRSQLRANAMKAYGNAMVPQLMYEIFRLIEKTYETTQMSNVRLHP